MENINSNESNKKIQEINVSLKNPELNGEINKQTMNASFTYETREVMVGGKKIYQISFSPTNFIEELGMKKMTIPHKVHDLGTNYVVLKITRKGEGFEDNVVVQWRMLLNGDFVVYSHEAFSGTLIIEER